MKGLDRYLTQEPEDYTPIYEAIYEAVLLPDNTDFDNLSDKEFTRLINKCTYEEWTLERMTELAKRYYSRYYKSYFENSFWYTITTYNPDDYEAEAHKKALALIEDLPFREMMDSAHLTTFFKVTDTIKNRQFRDEVFLLLTKLKCEFKKKC